MPEVVQGVAQRGVGRGGGQRVLQASEIVGAAHPAVIPVVRSAAWQVVGAAHLAVVLAVRVAVWRVVGDRVGQGVERGGHGVGDVQQQPGLRRGQVGGAGDGHVAGEVGGLLHRGAHVLGVCAVGYGAYGQQ